MSDLQKGDVLHKTDELVDYVRRYMQYSAFPLKVVNLTDTFTVGLIGSAGAWIDAGIWTLYIPRDIAEGMKR